MVEFASFMVKITFFFLQNLVSHYNLPNNLRRPTMANIFSSFSFVQQQQFPSFIYLKEFLCQEFHKLPIYNTYRHADLP